MSAALPNKSVLINALRGAFVADAASLGTHWIYDPKEMLKSVPSAEEPEFKDPPTPSFYSAEEFPGHYDVAGKLSPYGEQLLFVTEYLANLDKSLKTLNGEDMSQAFDSFLNSYTGRPDHAMKDFQENRKASKKFPDSGAKDNQAHCFVKALPVTCMFLGQSNLLDEVETAIRVHQNDDMAVEFGQASAKVLQHVMMGNSLSSALELLVANDGDVKKNVERAKSYSGKAESSLEALLLDVSHEIMKDKPDSPFYDLAGRSCALPGSFLVPAYLFSQPEQLSYESALRQNILGSGDTCGRCIWLGSVMSVVNNGVPESWLSNMHPDTMKQIDSVVDKLVSKLVENGIVSDAKSGDDKEL